MSQATSTHERECASKDQAQGKGGESQIPNQVGMAKGWIGFRSE